MIVLGAECCPNVNCRDKADRHMDFYRPFPSELRNAYRERLPVLLLVKEMDHFVCADCLIRRVQEHGPVDFTV